jgi:hypothetical protein
MSVGSGGIMISGGKPKNLERNLLQCHFVGREPNFKSSGIEPGLLGEKPECRCLSHDTVNSVCWVFGGTFGTGESANRKFCTYR